MTCKICGYEAQHKWDHDNSCPAYLATWAKIHYWRGVWGRALNNMPAKYYKDGRKYGQVAALARHLNYTLKKGNRAGKVDGMGMHNRITCGSPPRSHHKRTMLLLMAQE